MKKTGGLKKAERIVSQKQIEQLFSGKDSHSKAVFPLRIVFHTKQRLPGQPPASLLISVPKKHFKHAVDRNRIKRQLREAYRQNRQLLADSVPEELSVSLAFIWLASQHLPSAEVQRRVKALLSHIAKKL